MSCFVRSVSGAHPPRMHSSTLAAVATNLNGMKYESDSQRRQTKEPNQEMKRQQQITIKARVTITTESERAAGKSKNEKSETQKSKLVFRGTGFDGRRRRRAHLVNTLCSGLYSPPSIISVPFHFSFLLRSLRIFKKEKKRESKQCVHTLTLSLVPATRIDVRAWKRRNAMESSDSEWLGML